MNVRTSPLAVVDLGRMPYQPSWELQKKVWELRHDGRSGDVLLLTEHDHVYTLGKGGDGNHLLAGDEELRRTGAEVFRIDRGGDITYHGPGQLVGYPILDLQHHTPDIHKYLRDLEETIIVTLRSFGIDGGREEGLTGVWVGGEKIAAIGVKVSRWVTMHGFALNVNPDLGRFDRIIPCGIFHKGVTSMERILGHPVGMDTVKAAVASAFAEVFHARPTATSRESLEALVRRPLSPASNSSAA